MIVSVDRRITTRAMRIFLKKSESVSGTSFRPVFQDNVVVHPKTADRVGEAAHRNHHAAGGRLELSQGLSGRAGAVVECDERLAIWAAPEVCDSMPVLTW